MNTDSFCEKYFLRNHDRPCYIVRMERADKNNFFECCSKVIMSGVNSNVIMSGYGDENPDDEGREAARDNTKSVSRGVNDGEGIVGAGSQ